MCRLEDTLIDLYLSGYNNPTVSAADTVTVSLETDDVANLADDGLFVSSNLLKIFRINYDI